MSDVFYASYVVMWLVVLGQGILLLLVYRHFGIAALGSFEGVQRDGLTIGEIVPEINVTAQSGQASKWQPASHKPQLLMFLSPDCEPCANIAPYLNSLGQIGRNDAKVLVTGIVSGGREELLRFATKTSPTYACFADVGRDAIAAFRVRVTPFGFVIGEDGRVLAKGLCNDLRKLEAVLGAAGIDLREILAIPPAIVEPITVSPVSRPVGIQTEVGK